MQRTLTTDQLINPFVMNAVVARLRVEVDALSIFVDVSESRVNESSQQRA